MKTDRCDADKLARFLRSGDLTLVCVPDAEYETGPRFNGSASRHEGSGTKSPPAAKRFRAASQAFGYSLLARK